eukprot:m.188274 g.188274  ORF g.188274 m.188274 type:complete len:518 (+) comp32337_c1_seq1:225-1778(+)
MAGHAEFMRERKPLLTDDDVEDRLDLHIQSTKGHYQPPVQPITTTTTTTTTLPTIQPPGFVRWYIVAVFALGAVLQAALWNFYAPIHTTVQAVYGFSDSNVAWLANTANIAMLVSMPFSSVAVDLFGPRSPTIACFVMMFINVLSRLTPQLVELFGGHMSHTAIFWVNVGSMVFNGLSAAWLNFAGPVLSEIWFGANERAKITALLTVAPYVGVSLGYIVGPLVVAGGIEGKAALETLNYVYFGITTVLCISVISYFPVGPKHAPSLSAQKRKSFEKHEHDVDQGSASGRLCQALFGCGQREVSTLWIVSMVYGVPLGVFNGWGAVLAINLQDVGGLSAIDAGWIGCFMTLFGCVAAVVGAALNDAWPGRLKKWIIISNMIASVCFVAFCGRALELWVPESKLLSNVLVFGCSVAGGLFLNLPIALFYELGVEQSYPKISGNAAGMVVTLTTQIVQTIFLAVSFIPGAGGSSRWMDWAMMGVTPLFTLPLIFMKADYRRLRVDRPDIKPSKLDTFGL